MYMGEVYRNVIRIMKKINRTKNRRNVEYFLASLKTCNYNYLRFSKINILNTVISSVISNIRARLGN